MVSHLEYNYLTTLLDIDNGPALSYKKINIVNREEDKELRIIATEMNFLNRYFEETPTKAICVYRGNCNHIPKLMKLYPLEFHCYSVGTNLIKLEDEPNLIIFNQDFEESDLEKYVDKEVYFISNYENPGINKNDKLIEIEFLRNQELHTEDMQKQLQICQSLNPKVAFLKFRPPHYIENQKKSFEYLTGLVFKTIFSSFKSIETRLLVTDFKTLTSWNLKRLNDQMFFYNNIIRESLVKPFKKFPQFKYTFDRTIFYWILYDYFQKVGHQNPQTKEFEKLFIFLKM